MPKRASDSSYADSFVAQQLRDAIGARLKSSRLTLATVAKDVGRDESTLRAWLRGANRVAFEDVLALDSYFADLGHDGLLEELRPHPPRSYWRAKEETLEMIGRNKDCAALWKLGEAYTPPASPLSLLSEAGLLEKAMVYFRLDGNLYTIHLGRDCPAPFNEIVLGREMRRHADAGLGSILHRQLLAQTAADAPRPCLLRLISPHGSCLLFSLPLNDTFILSIALPSGAV